MAHTSGITPLYQVFKPPFTIESPGYEKKVNETVPRRHPRARDGLIERPSEDVRTVFDIIRRSARLFPESNAVGSRKLIKLHKGTYQFDKKVDGKVQKVEKEWTYFELSGYSFLTYKQYEKHCLEVGSGLRKLGLGRGDKVFLFGSTSAQWIAMSHACATQSMSIITAYDSLGSGGLEHSLVQTQAEVMYIDPYLLKTASEPLKKSKVHTLIVNEASIFGGSELLEEFKTSHPKIKVISFDDLCKAGESEIVDPVYPDPDDLYCVMYTSGSGGVPKGVRIAHRNLIAGIAGLYTCVSDCVTHNDVLLAYLPLAHVLEMALENLGYYFGGAIGYGNPRTLSDTSVRNCAGDMRELAPTIMPGVPQVYETIRKGVMTRLNASVLLRTLFWRAFAYKSFMVKHKLPGACLLDSIVFGKVREMTGGRIRFLFNGGSAISLSTKHFLSLVLAPMFTGYGLTETCANGSLGSPLEFTLHSIGTVPGSIEVKLVSVPEFGYSADTKIPQGEILIKGGAVMLGYYENEEETKRSFTEDGWFKTGDVGEFDTDGHLRVIDRIKNLVKLLSGEYVALEKLEAIYRGVQGIMNVMVYADSDHSRPIAVVMPNETSLLHMAREMGIDEHSMHSDPRIQEILLKDLQAAGKRGGLSSAEIVAGIVITPEEWTPASVGSPIFRHVNLADLTTQGLVTATQKLNRRAINTRYKSEIHEALKNA
ncbi:long-chain-fatty-acid ligase [Fusarium phyllophilum]|uniref:Long-chain-fatty-acid ligase n=1 Tax=Fusarium phyllophilum TaxID=47803 RepID=A0A8H5IGB2_9HYPO|nr:long-chain-fatty-acid ligase [Fusarium phyllophilum]